MAENLKILFQLFFAMTIACLGLISCQNDLGATSSQKVVEKIPSIENDSIDYLIKKLMKEHSVPGVSIAFIKNSKLHATRNYGVLTNGESDKINPETIFSVGSISKFVNAVLILKLVDDKILDLDTDINNYLTTWEIQKNEYNSNTPVTLRTILSHTAGFSVHGFEDYLPDAKLPTTVQILKGVSPAMNEKVELIQPVGKTFKYSGGGITVTQMLIEDLTKMPYEKAAQKYIFEPLGLTRSSYENPLPAEFGNIAKAHNEMGVPDALPRGYESMPEKAASGLWTTPSDLAKLLSILYGENKEYKHFISPSLIQEMISPQENSKYGLGPQVRDIDKDLMVFHGGSNNSYKAELVFFWNQKSGYLLFTNGANGTKLIMGSIDILDEYSFEN